MHLFLSLRINFYFNRISPPPIRGKFIPISKWGPHDRYAPTRKEQNRFSQGTTQKSTSITTPPYVTKPMKNTVIPFWFSNTKTTNYQSNNINEINIEMIEKSTNSIEDFVKIEVGTKHNEDDLSTTQMSSYIFEDEGSRHTSSSTDTSKSMSSQHVNTKVSSIHDGMREIPSKSSTISNLLDFQKNSFTLEVNSSISTNKIPSKEETTSSNFERIMNQSNQETINISAKENIFSEVSTAANKDMIEKDNNANFHMTLTDTDVYDEEKTISSETNLDKEEKNKNETYNPMEDTTITNINNSKTSLESNIGDMIEETTMVTNQFVHELHDDNLSQNDYDDYKEKSLEDIQNELMKLLDEMTMKYHNGSTVVI